MRTFTAIIFGLTIIMLFGFGYVFVSSINEVERQGGVKQLLINTGKELKDIQHEVDQYDPSEK